MQEAPTLAQVEAWEDLTIKTFPDYLVDELLSPEEGQNEWVGVFKHLGASEDPGEYTALVLNALQKWMLAVWPLIDQIVPNQLDMLFPVIIGARKDLTLPMAQNIITNYPRFIQDNWGGLGITEESTPQEVNLKVAEAYTKFIAENLFVGLYE